MGGCVKVKVLFLAHQCLPTLDANGNCVNKLRANLAKLNVSSDVLSFRLKNGIPDQKLDDFGTIYIANTWMRFGHTHRIETPNRFLIMLKLFYVVPVRIFHFLCGGRYVNEKYYAPAACLSFKRKLEHLCAHEKYDWVVSVSIPFCIHETAASANLHGAKLALYNFDPYSHNVSFSAANMKLRLQEELSVCSKADIVFTSLEHCDDWENSALSSQLNKVHFIPYPNLTPHTNTDGSCPFTLSDNEITLVYIGALNDGIRHPNAMLHLFDKMLELEPSLHLYVVGGRSGHIVSAQLEDAVAKFAEHITVSPPIPFAQAMDLLNRADIAINLGNRTKNQMPSKLLDYIASGKPIINISPNNPCNTAPYIERYSLAMQLYDDDILDDAKICTLAEKAVSFVIANKGKQLPWSEVSKQMKGFTASDVAKTFYDALCSAKE